jgi:hypothetical protein
MNVTGLPDISIKDFYIFLTSPGNFGVVIYKREDEQCLQLVGAVHHKTEGGVRLPVVSLRIFK